MKTMKSNTIILIASMLIASVLTVSAQTLPWQSTSSMQDAHSGFTPRVTEVGAYKAAYIPMRSTSTMMQVEAIATPEDENSGSGAKGNIRRGFITPSDPGNQSEDFPIGEPWVLLLFAAASAAGIAVRKRTRLVSQTENNAK